MLTDLCVRYDDSVCGNSIKNSYMVESLVIAGLGQVAVDCGVGKFFFSNSLSARVKSIEISNVYITKMDVVRADLDIDDAATYND